MSNKPHIIKVEVGSDAENMQEVTIPADGSVYMPPTLQAKDLRIGNWLFFEGKPVIVDEIHSYEGGHEIEADGEGVTVIGKPDFYSPIPLTPEILERAGLVFDKGVGWWFQKGATNNIFALAWAAEGVKWVYNTKENVHLLYLHQLQNLFHALTGTELEIKPLD